MMAKRVVVSEQAAREAEMNSAFKRQWSMLQYIAGRVEGVTLNDLAKHFSVSVKTVRRDFKLLRSIPFSFREEILPQNNQRRYYYDFFQGIFPLNLTFDELFAMYVGRHLMSPLRGTYFWDALQTGFAKIQKVLRPSVVEYAERVSPLFYQLERGGSDYSSLKREIDMILLGMEEQRCIEIKYKSLTSRTPKNYCIHPYNFVYYQGFLYIVGWSCKDNEMRFWKVNRLKSTMVTNDYFDVPADFNIKKYLSKALCPFVSEHGSITICVRFKKSMATQIQEMAWDSFKKMTSCRNGALDVEMEVESGKALFHWLLGFGTDVEILSPKSFRDEFKVKVQEVLKKYQ